MKRIVTILIFIVLPNYFFAQGFNSIHTPDGINVFAVGDSGKIYRSTNSGNGWFIYNYTSDNLKSVYSLGNEVWFAGEPGRVYKSNISLNPIILINLNQNFTINSIQFISPNLGFLCGDGGRVYKSNNGGSIWNLMNSGISNEKLNSISFKDSQNGVVVGDNGKVYITSDGGLNWTLEITSTSRNLLKVKYFSDGICAVGEYGTLLLKTSIFTWAQVNTRTNSDIRGVTGTSINDIHICGGGGFVRNNKNGSSNFLNFEINPMMANLVDIFYYNSNLGFAVSSLNKAVIKTTNGGLTWDLPTGAAMNISWQSKPGVSGSSLGENLCVHPTNRNTIFTNYSGRAYVSRNRGESWSQIGNQIPNASTPHSFFISPVDTNIWLCSIEASGGDKVVRTTDYGQTWSTSITRNFTNYGTPLQIDRNNPNTYYFAPDYGGFYKSTDNGALFIEISNNYPFRSPKDIIVIDDVPNIILLADGLVGSGLADLFKSTNGGIEWVLKFTDPSGSFIPSMCNNVFDNGLALYTTWPGGNIYKTTNMGENWDLNHTNPFSGWGSAVCLEDPSVIMSGSWSGGNTSLSTNGGSSWTTITGLNGSGGTMVLVDRGYTIGQAGSSIYKLNVSYSVLDSQIYIPSLSIKVNLKILSEGFYYPLFNQLSRKDTFVVYLRNNVSPFSLFDSAKSIIDSLSLSGQFSFANAKTGIYYVSIKHLNSIETWSKDGGEYLVNDNSIYNYDFTTSSSQAYGNNLKLKSGKYCLYSGDVNQDGFITLFDVIPIYNDAANFVYGEYLKTDLTGDNIVDLTDVTICYNNSSNFIRVRRP